MLGRLDVVDIFLEMFNGMLPCVRLNFSEKLVILSTYCVKTFAAEAAIEPATL